VATLRVDTADRSITRLGFNTSVRDFFYGVMVNTVEATAVPNILMFTYSPSVALRAHF
jgi:hypothetical protein